jgi:hypothetical protein
MITKKTKKWSIITSVEREKTLKLFAAPSKSRRISPKQNQKPNIFNQKEKRI